MRSRALVVAGAIAVAAVAATYLGTIRWWGALLSIAVLVWFTLPGVAMARRLVRGETSGAHWLFGPVWGIGLSLLGLLALWALGGRGWWVLVGAPWLAWMLMVLPPVRRGLDLALPRFDRRDVLALLLLALIVPIVAGLPYAHVAEPVHEGGKAYRAYFTADFVWAMSVVAEVSKGDMPPRNPFQLGGHLHYYWLAHFLSAVEYRVFGPWGLSIEEITLANSIGYSLAFLAFLYGLVRAFGVEAWAGLAGCSLVFLSNSFEALDRIVVWWGRAPILEPLRDINIDAVTRWFYQGMPVDGLQRMILYQPHHLGGYAIGLSALLVVGRVKDAGRPMVAVVAGSLLGLSLLLSSFTAIIIGTSVAVVYAVRLLTPPQWKAIPVCAVLGAAPVLAAVALSTALAYVDPAASSLVLFGPNPVAFMHWPYALLISFGPMLIFGAAGLLVAMATRSGRGAWPVAVLAGVAIGFYFFTDVPDMQHVWVGWRAGHLLFIASTVFAGLLLTALGRAPSLVRVPGMALVLAVTLGGLPSVLMDIYNAQDISNERQGAGFPWTLVLTRSEVEALDWLKRSTPPNVVVQANVQERANASWGYIPAFGERRMSAGLPIAMIPFQPYQDATDAVGAQIFAQGTAAERSAAARRLGIDYVYAGPVEQQRHPDLVATLETRSDLFPVVFRNDGVLIFWVAP